MSSFEPQTGGAQAMMQIAASLRTAALPLPDIESEMFATLFDTFADAQMVLIGEASHGTAEFYQSRAAITRRLITHHGFTIVAAEADWPDADQLDRCVRGRDEAYWPQKAFSRFPTWLWRNTHVRAFAQWLKIHNSSLTRERRVEFRGLDIYSLRSSIREVLGYLDRIDPALARDARHRYGCITPWHNDPVLYGHFTERGGLASCEDAVLAQLQILLDQRLNFIDRDSEALFNARQNAQVITAAEQYYRAMYRGNIESWNLRDRHMFETLQRIRYRQRSPAKIVVWAHNSHVGDARATQMGSWGQLTLGQLCRQTYGNQVALIGMGTDHGTVLAANDWDGPAQVMSAKRALPGSWEQAFQLTGIPKALYSWRHDECRAFREATSATLLERAIGVIYRPETERQSHYFEAVLAKQFDAWLWFETTEALTPLDVDPSSSHEEDTFPFGL
jgi:erythromycin esterase-like protein